MSDQDYHKFGSNPPLNNQPIQNDFQYQENYNQTYQNPADPQNNSYNQNQNPNPAYPPPQYNYNYGAPQYAPNQVYQPPNQNSYVYGQPIIAPQPYPQQPAPPRNDYSYHSTLQCLTACLIIAAVYQFVLIVIFGINGNTLEFPTNVTIGLICAIVDFLCLLISNHYFRSSKNDKSKCKVAMTVFCSSLVLFILTYVITFSQHDYYVAYDHYIYNPSIYYLAIQVVFRVFAFVMALGYVKKRMAAD